MELKKIQKDIWQNKLNKGFNTTDVNKEYYMEKWLKHTTHGRRKKMI